MAQKNDKKNKETVEEKETSTVDETQTDDTKVTADEVQVKSKEEELTEEIENLKDQLLRQVAEFDNFKKRSVKEKSDAYKDATINAVSELLGVLDNFDRALEFECSDEEFKKGIIMIQQTLKQSFEKLGVKEIEAEGCTFDPNVHNAVNQITDENYPENTVCSVFQKGYILGDKVVRHAMVVVANP